MIAATCSWSGLSTTHRWGGVSQPAHLAANVWRQHELVPELKQLFSVDVEADVVLGALTENLFVDAGSVAALAEVVADRRAAPADVERKLDAAACLPDRRIVQAPGDSDGPGRRTQ